jgi:dephospho-CoA kinase
MHIAFAGKAGSGKDTAAKYLIERYGYRKVSFAEPIKRICKELFDWPEDDPRWREAYQKFGTDFARSLDPDVWIKKFKQTLTREHRDVCVLNQIYHALECESSKEAACCSKYLCDEKLFGGFVCTDLRFPNEAKWLLENGWMVAVISAFDTERMLRLKLRDGHFPSEEAIKHESESFTEEIQSLPGVITIHNNGTLHELHTAIKALLEKC